MTTRRKLLAAGKFALGLALLVVVVRWLVPDLSSVIDRVRLDPALLVVGFACTLAASVVTSARWKLMVEAMGGTRLPYPIYFHALVLTRVLGQFTSTLAMDLVGRGLALRTAGSDRGLGHAMTQAILERIFDLLLPGALLVWAVIVRALAPATWAAALSHTLVCLAFAGLAAVILWPLARLGLGLYRWIARRRRRPDPLGAAGDAPISRRVAAQVGLLSAARYLMVLGQFWAIAAAIGVPLDFTTIASATPLGQLAGIIGITPGALGIQEAGWAGAFTWLEALDAPTIGLFVLGQRALVLANFSLLSLVSYPWARAAGQRSEAAVVESGRPSGAAAVDEPATASSEAPTIAADPRDRS